MSHFTVWVIGNDPEALLAPFDDELPVATAKDDDGETYQYNPNAKWDWYRLGGRWRGYFPVRDGVEVQLGEPGVFDNKPSPGCSDVVKKGDVDWDKMLDESREHARAVFKAIAEGKDPWFAEPVKDGESEEEYAERVAKFPVPHAILTPDGEWIECGRVGWFATVADKKPPEEWAGQVKQYIDSLDDDTTISLYDCHI